MTKYKFMGYCLSPRLALVYDLPMRENTEVPEALIRKLFDRLIEQHREEHGEMSYDEPSWGEFCEEIADPHGAIAAVEGDFWAERVA
jgi:hypothetical protein